MDISLTTFLVDRSWCPFVYNKLREYSVVLRQNSIRDYTPIVYVESLSITRVIHVLTFFFFLFFFNLDSALDRCFVNELYFLAENYLYYWV